MSWLLEALLAQGNDVGRASVSTPSRQKMVEVRAAFRQALDTVRGDAGLSELGRQQLIARAWTNARDELARLAQIDFDAHVARYNELEMQVFGTGAASSGADAVSFRDAADRAANLKSADEATTLLGTAQLSNDAVLAKAVVMAAWQKDWPMVVEQYAATHAQVSDQLAELVSLREHLESRTSVLGGAMAGTLPKPSDLQDLSLAQIAQYAQAEPSRSLDAVISARTRGQATPLEEKQAREQAAAEARARAARGE